MPGGLHPGPVAVGRFGGAGMSNASLILLLLGLMSLCALIVTTVLALTAHEVRRILRRVQTILPDCAGAVHEAHRAFGEAHQLLKRTNSATRRVETVLHTASETATQAMEQFALLRKKAQAFFGHHNGNGARGGPRHQHRSTSG